MPINSATTRFTSEPVEPTAASAWLPAKFPATTMSAALYRHCRTPVAITGKEYVSSILKSGPVVMSIS